MEMARLAREAVRRRDLRGAIVFYLFLYGSWGKEEELMCVCCAAGFEVNEE